MKIVAAIPRDHRGTAMIRMEPTRIGTVAAESTAEDWGLVGNLVGSDREDVAWKSDVAPQE